MLGNTLILILTIGVCQAQIYANSESTRVCEPIEIEACKGIGYNVTGMPNFFNHETQADARQAYTTFKPLIQYGCSTQLPFFLCSVHAPMCTDKVQIPIGPCRPLCESVKEKCEPTLLEFGFNWPPQLNCSLFPEKNDADHMCMEGPAEAPAPVSQPPTPRKNGKKNGSSRHKNINGQARIQPVSVSQCSKYLYADRAYVFMNTSKRCGQSCDKDVLFSAENKRFAEIWMAVWSVACFMTSAFTVFLYFTDTIQFEAPDRAVVCLSICYCLQSFGYFIRLLVGRGAASCFTEGNSSVLVHQGLENHYCSAVFILNYYFNNAASMLWVVVTITWLMTGPLRYSAEEIRRRMAVLHFTAWILPACMTIAILVMRMVDAEELTGICGVGNQNRDTLLAFTILPQICCLCLGFGFLVSGAITLYSFRKYDRSEEEKMKCGMQAEYAACSRTWIFAILYVIPACCVLGVNIYEYVNRESWTLYQNGPMSRPYVEYFSFKLFMSNIVGITAGLWIWCSRSGQYNQQINKVNIQQAPPLLVATPFAHQPYMVQNQYFVPQSMLHKIQQTATVL